MDFVLHTLHIRISDGIRRFAVQVVLEETLENSTNKWQSTETKQVQFECEQRRQGGEQTQFYLSRGYGGIFHPFQFGILGSYNLE